jgi:hypothetical protein
MSKNSTSTTLPPSPVTVPKLHIVAVLGQPQPPSNTHPHFGAPRWDSTSAKVIKATRLSPEGDEK